MKRIYISDVIHAQLKKEAAANGRTLQWWVDEKLAGGVITSIDQSRISTNQISDAVNVPPVATESKESPPTKSSIVAEIKRIEAEVDSADYENQDPDYWAEVNKKKAKITDLWKEWHSL